MVNRNEPTELTPLSALGKAVAASCGRSHSVVVMENGDSYTFGSNKHGQCGTGECKSTPQKEECHVTPVKALVEGIKDAKCGAEFTIWLSSDGGLYSAGLPQYGQLGHGTDEEYNAAEFSIKLTYAPQPTPKRIEGSLKDRKIVAFNCGHNHSVAVDEDGIAYSWGFGGYGRLGHKVQQDEFAPRPIEHLLRGHTCAKDSLIACGSTTSLVTTGACGGWLPRWPCCDGALSCVPCVGCGCSFACHPFSFRGSGCSAHGTDLLLRQDQGHRGLADVPHGPQLPPGALDACRLLDPIMTISSLANGRHSQPSSLPGLAKQAPSSFPSFLQGWVVRDMSAGNVTYALCADEKCVTWGQAQYGELGYGPGGKKSSANPDIVPALDGVKTMRVACGMGHTMFVVDPSTDMSKFPVFRSQGEGVGAADSWKS